VSCPDNPGRAHEDNGHSGQFALNFPPRGLIYWEERAGLLTALQPAVPSWQRIVGLTLRARAGINPAAHALIDTLREVGGQFSS